VENVYHFEAEGTVDHEKGEVCDFANVDHTVQVVVAFNEGKTALFATDGTFDYGNRERLRFVREANERSLE